jgi:acid stress-induced BolA-like protein IbaG/YrbA
MVNVNAIEKDIVAKLKEKYGPAAVSSGYGGPLRFTITIISEDFEGKPEDERQDEIWGYIHKDFKYSEFKYIGMIVTYTPEEYEAFQKEMAG